MKENIIAFEKYADSGEKIFFPAYDHNCLYSMNKKTYEIEYIARIPELELVGKRTFFSVAYYNESIILIPFYKYSIWVYDLKTQKFSIFSIKKNGDFDVTIDMPEEALFSSYSIYNNKLFVFPHYYPAIIEIDMEEWTINYNQKPIVELNVKKKNAQPFVTNVFTQCEYAYCAIANSNNILVYNMKNDDYVIHAVSNSSCGFNGIFKDGNNIVLTPRLTGAVLLWDENGKKAKEFSNYPKGFKYQCIPFHNAIKNGDEYILIANQANQIVRLNPYTGNMQSYEVLEKIIIPPQRIYDSYDNIMAYGKNGTKLWFIIGADRIYCEYDLNDSSVVCKKLKCENAAISYSDMVKICILESDIIVETGSIGLEDYINGIVESGD